MASLIRQIVGHQTQVRDFLSAVHGRRLGSAYMLVGPSGVGKKTLAIALAQLLACESQSGCGHCLGCKQYEFGMCLVAPDGASIKIDQARDILQFLNLRSQGKFRIVIVDQVQLMVAQAANALLKTLEEPPPGTLFLLISPSPSGVLSTIRSRCQVVRFEALSPQELMQIANLPEWVAHAAGGSLETATQLNQPEVQELRHLAITTLLDFTTHTPQFLFTSWRESFKDRSEAIRICRLWLGFVRDALVLRVNGDSGFIRNQDLRSDIFALSQFQSLEVLAERLGAFELELKSRDVVLAFEELALRSL